MTAAPTELRPGVDFRLPVFRREVFLRFYHFHLRYGTHPGCVYFLFPFLAAALDWDAEQRAWFGWLNGQTQNPITSLRLWNAAPSLEQGDAAVAYLKAHYRQLEWDTDRRYHKARFEVALRSYRTHTDRAGGQMAYWRQAQCWDDAWRLARQLYSMGRLSAWSYLEYLYILDVQPWDADTFLLEDREGSRSHRNGLCIVSGHDEYDWHRSNPGFDGRYSPDLLAYLDGFAHGLLSEAQRRWPALRPTALTLESALCTYKSWHRPRRRYPNVYADMHYYRLRRAERALGRDGYTALCWDARRALPPHLRLEDNPYDPGLVPGKQDWYRTTGEVIMIEDDPAFYPNGFSRAVQAQQWGVRRDPV